MKRKSKNTRNTRDIIDEVLMTAVENDAAEQATRDLIGSKTKQSVHKALDEFLRVVQLGYTHDNFYTISRVLAGVNRHFYLEEIKMLESNWRDSYTDSVNEEALLNSIETVKARFS